MQNALVQIAIPNPRVIPFRPPKYWPTSIRNNVSTANKKVVRMNLIVLLVLDTSKQVESLPPSREGGGQSLSLLRFYPLDLDSYRRCGLFGL